MAHRLTTIEHSDIIYVIEGRQIVAQGNFQELMEHSPAFQKISGQSGNIGKKTEVKVLRTENGQGGYKE